MVSYKNQERTEFPLSTGNSMKKVINKYLTNYILVDNYTEEEFLKALFEEFFKKDHITVEKCV
jgi:ATP-dependent Clp protease adapter protein ClpS